MKKWETYMKSTVKDAAKKLPEDCRQVFIDVFNECGCIDLYGGELKQYLQIVFQQLQSRKEEVNKFKLVIKNIKSYLK
jgi:hypothetical protein